MAEQQLHDTEKLRRKELELNDLEKSAGELTTMSVDIQLSDYSYAADRLGTPVATYDTHQYVEKAICSLESEIRSRALELLRIDLQYKIDEAKRLMADVEARFEKWKS